MLYFRRVETRRICYDFRCDFYFGHQKKIENCSKKCMNAIETKDNETNCYSLHFNRNAHSVEP